jgi:hypothetical protein
VPAGAEDAAGVASAAPSVVFDFFERLFFPGVASALVAEPEAGPVEALSAAPASSAVAFFELLRLVVVADPRASVLAAVPLTSPESAVLDFLERLFFVPVSAFVAALPSAAVLSAASAFVFLERLFFGEPESALAAVSPAAALSAASAGFFDRLFFFAVEVPLSASARFAEPPAASALLLFFDRLFFVDVESSGEAELSAEAALFFLDFDPDVLPVPAVESESLAELSAFAFFLLFFFVVVLESL